MNRAVPILAGLSLLLLTPAAALADGSGARRLFYERTLMAAADARCGLFTPPVAAALKAGAAQARGAALRAGVEPAALKQTAAQATARARSTSCASTDLRTAAARVRSGFEGWSRMTRIGLDGWTADRTRAPGRWRLSQTSAAVTLGLEGPTDRPAVTAAGGAAPTSVRLRVRDPAKDPHPDLRGRARDQRMPSGAASKVFWASSREPAPAGLTPGAAEGGRLWRLPAGASTALAALDPRETVAVEFIHAGRGRETVKPVYFEVGDFAAGLAFLQAGAAR